MKNIGILGLGKYVPHRVLSNHDLEKMVETNDEWITSRTGIKKRHIAGKHERSSHMAIKAAQEALHQAGIDPHKIELILVATATPDHVFPSVGCLVQKALGAKHAAAFDVSAACCGFLFALTTAKQYLANGMYKNALVIASEKFSNIVNWNDRGTCVLFGDGAGAAVLGHVPAGQGLIADYILSLGEFADTMTVVTEDLEPLDQKNDMMHKPHIVMHGQELFKIAVNSMAQAVELTLEKAKVKIEDVDCVVPHQANDRIIAAVAKKLGIPKEKFFINIEKYGNMSAASISVALYEAVEEGRIQKGDHVVLVAFGAGLVAAANVVRW